MVLQKESWGRNDWSYYDQVVSAKPPSFPTLGGEVKGFRGHETRKYSISRRRNFDAPRGRARPPSGAQCSTQCPAVVRTACPTAAAATTRTRRQKRLFAPTGTRAIVSVCGERHGLLFRALVRIFRIFRASKFLAAGASNPCEVRQMIRARSAQRRRRGSIWICRGRNGLSWTRRGALVENRRGQGSDRVGNLIGDIENVISTRMLRQRPGRHLRRQRVRWGGDDSG